MSNRIMHNILNIVYMHRTAKKRFLMKISRIFWQLV